MLFTTAVFQLKRKKATKIGSFTKYTQIIYDRIYPDIPNLKSDIRWGSETGSLSYHYPGSTYSNGKWRKKIDFSIWAKTVSLFPWIVLFWISQLCGAFFISIWNIFWILFNKFQKMKIQFIPKMRKKKRSRARINSRYSYFFTRFTHKKNSQITFFFRIIPVFRTSTKCTQISKSMNLKVLTLLWNRKYLNGTQNFKSTSWKKIHWFFNPIPQIMKL